MINGPNMSDVMLGDVMQDELRSRANTWPSNAAICVPMYSHSAATRCSKSDWSSSSQSSPQSCPTSNIPMTFEGGYNQAQGDMSQTEWADGRSETRYSSKRADSSTYGKLSYAELITRAIESAPGGRLTLSQIYEWMIENVPYFRDKADNCSSAGWKNSIRHNLSLHSRFKREMNETAGRSSWWTIDYTMPAPTAGSSSISRASSRARANTMDSKLLSTSRKQRGVRRKVGEHSAVTSHGTPPRDLTSAVNHASMINHTPFNTQQCITANHIRGYNSYLYNHPGQYINTAMISPQNNLTSYLTAPPMNMDVNTAAQQAVFQRAGQGMSPGVWPNNQTVYQSAMLQNSSRLAQQNGFQTEMHPTVGLPATKVFEADIDCSDEFLINSSDPIITNSFIENLAAFSKIVDDIPLDTLSNLIDDTSFNLMNCVEEKMLNTGLNENVPVNNNDSLLNNIYSTNNCNANSTQGVKIEIPSNEFGQINQIKTINGQQQIFGQDFINSCQIPSTNIKNEFSAATKMEANYSAMIGRIKSENTDANVKMEGGNSFQKLKYASVAGSPRADRKDEDLKQPRRYSFPDFGCHPFFSPMSSGLSLPSQSYLEKFCKNSPFQSVLEDSCFTSDDKMKIDEGLMLGNNNSLNKQIFKSPNNAGHCDNLNVTGRIPNATAVFSMQTSKQTGVGQGLNAAGVMTAMPIASSSENFHNFDVTFAQPNSTGLNFLGSECSFTGPPSDTCQEVTPSNVPTPPFYCPISLAHPGLSQPLVQRPTSGDFSLHETNSYQPLQGLFQKSQQQQLLQQQQIKQQEAEKQPLILSRELLSNESDNMAANEISDMDCQPSFNDCDLQFDWLDSFLNTECNTIGIECR